VLRKNIDISWLKIHKIFLLKKLVNRFSDEVFFILATGNTDCLARRAIHFYAFFKRHFPFRCFCFFMFLSVVVYVVGVIYSTMNFKD
jgi:uncharacterized membrane protein YecN with MAPEG domain